VWEWKTRDREKYGGGKAGLENAGPNRMGGKRRIGKPENKFSMDGKNQDHTLWNAKWIRINV